MAKLSTTVTQAVIGAVVVAIVVVAGYFVFFTGDKTNTVTARFLAATGIYDGTPVRILGVDVGEVTGVKPGPQYVDVTMTYDAKYRIKADGANAVTVANSLVSDRYIQLGPLIGAKDTSATLPDNATIDADHTSGPAELDEIYDQLDRLSVALGPNGANKGGQGKGALSALLKVSAANLQGNGAALGRSITNLAAAAQTLSDHRGGLFGTVKNLQKFTATLKSSDGQVRLFNKQLAEVAGSLAAERSDLGAALNLLGLALNEVSAFVKNNAAKFHTDIQGLRNITNILTRQKASLQETLAIAPIALANIVHVYNPANGTLGTRSNLVSLTNLDPKKTVTQVVCGLLGNSKLGGIAGIGDLLKGLGCSTSKSGSTATSKAVSSAGVTGLDEKGANLVETMLNGGIPNGSLIGSGS